VKTEESKNELTGDAIVRSVAFCGETAAMVLLSGGQDSTVCLFWALRKFKHVEAVCFNYGQKHSLETEAARAIAYREGVPFRLLDAGLIAELSVNSLTNPAVTMDKEQTGAAPPNTFVPGRNLLFLTLAAIVAREKRIFHLVTGVSQADYSGYPDCRDTFIRSLNVTLNLAMDEQFVIHTPLMQRNKKEVWQLADELGVFDLVQNETITCYNGIRGAGCGECPSCKLRRKGLEEYLVVR
jgi:7-cyano-7-deazaguanine synthase